MPEHPELRTKRLLLRAPLPPDAPAVQRLAGDREVALNTLEIPHPYEDGMAEAWIRDCAAAFDTGEAVTFAITHRPDGLLVGAMALTLEPDHHRAELGFWVGRPFRDRGYATEAARAVVDYGFRTLELNRIFAQHFSRNARSGRVLRKAGLRHEGRLRQHVLKWGVYVDVEQYGILRREHQPQQPSERP